MKELDHTERPHARCSPSDYRRWSNCPGSITLEKKLGKLLPPDEAGPAAQLGTELHEIAQLVLEGHVMEEKPPASIVPYIEYCASLVGEKYVEKDVPLYFSPNETGCADYICISEDGDTIEVCDLKTGQFPVYAEGNMQALIYGIGAANLLAPSAQHLKLTIHQFGEAYTWELSMDEARALAVPLGEAAKAALDDSVTTLVPSDTACKYCRAKAYCSAFTSKLVESFDTITTGDMERLSDSAMVKLFDNANNVKKALTAIESALYGRLNNGERIEGLTISNGRKGNKIWSKDVDPVAAMKAAGIDPNEAIETKPISPSQALKLSKDVTGWEQPEGKPKLTADNHIDVDEWFEKI